MATPTDNTIEIIQKANTDFEYSPDNVEGWRPLVFVDEVEAYDFYARYGKSRGFGIRFGGCVRKTDKKTGEKYLRYIYLECHKQGQKQVKKGRELLESSFRKADIRTGCEANMRLKKDWDKNGFVIYLWTDRHNHEFVDLDKVHFLPMHREIKPEQKAIIDVHLNVGLSIRSTYDALLETYGTIEDMGFTRKDLKNYASTRRRMEMFPGDAIVMQKWLREQSIAKPGFFYDIQLDDDQEIASIFWADAVMISDYAKFGDFVSFDTTYRTNDNSRPLGVFVGFNHHKTTCVFGAALMYDETALSFKWVFESLMRCMDNKVPMTMMTDQAPAIALAIRDIFPETFHALCSWHIDQNARKRLGAKANSTFLDIFNHLIKYVDTEPEFEFCWQHMLDSCFEGKPTSDNSWLSFIYTFRKQWSSTWVKDHFTAGKTTTQLSEQLNAFARHYLEPNLHISDLMKRFQSLVDDLRFNEKSRDFFMQNTIPENKFKNSNVMKHAAELFTPHVFKIIQHEFEIGMDYIIEEANDVDFSMSHTEMLKMMTGAYNVLLVQRWENKGTEEETLIEEQTVTLDRDTSSIKCSCRYFENWFLVCRHVLRAMEVHGAYKQNDFCRVMPNDFVVGRWTRKFAKPCSPLPRDIVSIPSTHGERYKKLFNIIVPIGNQICYNEEAFSCMLNYIYDGSREALKLLENASPSSAPTRSDCSSSIGEEDEEYLSQTFKKRRKDPVESDHRLKSNLEIRHLKWKQQLKRQMIVASSSR